MEGTEQNTEQKNIPRKNNDDFYAVVSALARFIETADSNEAPKE